MPKIITQPLNVEADAPRRWPDGRGEQVGAADNSSSARPDGTGAATEAEPLRPTPRPERGSWAARYGQLIMRDGVASLPRALYLYQGVLGLSAQEIWFVSYILAHKWDAELPYPSLRQMAAQSGVDLSWLKRLRKKLEEKNFLEIVQRHDERGGQGANSYDFSSLFAQLEDAVAADPPSGNAISEDRIKADPPDELQSDRSFVARYGRIIARLGVAAVPRGIFTQQGALNLSAQQIWFVCYILSYQWDTALPYPSLKRMVLRTGYSEPQLHSIKDSLVECGYLRLVRRHSTMGGQDTNGYDFSGLIDALSSYLEQESVPANEPEPAVASTASPRRGRRNMQRVTPTDNTEGGAPGLVGGGREEFSAGGVLTVNPLGVSAVKPPAQLRLELAADDNNELGGVHLVKPGGVRRVKQGGVRSLKSPGAQGSVTGGALALVTGGAYSLDEVEAYNQEAYNQEIDSNRTTKKENGDERDDQQRYSAYIASVIFDFSQTLGDSDHVGANVAQALRLWQGSGLDETIFVQQCLYEALNRTRQAQGAQGSGFVRNKMAYFFVVLRDIVQPTPGAARRRQQ